MPFVASDTDYRPFVAYGSLPGLDVAFYSNRYLYHTSRDDFDHVHPAAVMHLGLNLVGSIGEVCGQVESLDRFGVVEGINDPLGQFPSAGMLELLTLGFLFHDVFGKYMIVSSHFWSVVSSLFFLIIFLLVIGRNLSYLSYPEHKKHVVQIALCFLCVVLSCFVVYILSLLKVFPRSYSPVVP
jgi:hypothetical protein